MKYEWGKHPNSRNGWKKGDTSKYKNINWKGGEASYTAFHHWLKNNYGKASKCENLNCKYPRFIRRRGYKRKVLATKPRQYQWALLKGKKHEQKKENYIQLCASCHAIYDKNKRRKIISIK